MRSLGKALKNLIIVCLCILCILVYLLFVKYLPMRKTTTQQQSSKTEQEILDTLFAKRWITDSDPKWLLDFTEGLILLGPYPGSIDESRKFDIIKINTEEQSIIIHVTEVNYPSDPDSDNDLEKREKVDHFDRITLINNKLIYEYKYKFPEERMISTWIAE
ncbi:MAG: hypothetical protein ACM3ZC_11595 [Bacteroidota bacterium]